MVKIKQKAAAPEIDWTGIDAVIGRESHPQLAKRLPAKAGDNEGNLIAPGINRIYARIGDDTEATIVMYRVSQNADILQLHAPILVYWNKNENSYVYDGDDTGAYNQASGGGTPTTSSYLASYWLAVANDALPNAYVLDDATNGLVINTNGVPSGLAPGTARNVAIGASSTAWEARALVNADLPVVDASHGGTGNSTNTANNLLVGAGTSPVTFIAPSTAGRMLRSNGTVWNPYLNNIAATAAPTTGDDSNDGYAVGSYWLDLTNDRIYIAIDVSVGAAIWKPVDLAGTVTSVALTVPSFLSVSGSPITSSGTLAVSLVNQDAGKVLAAPPGSSGTPSFQLLTGDHLAGALASPPEIGATAPNPGTFTKLTVTGDYSQVGAVTVTSTTTDTTLMSASLQWAANFFTAGRQVLVRLSGYANTATNHQAIWRFKLDTVTIISAGTATTTSGGDLSWHVEFLIGCATTGAGGTGRAQSQHVLGLAFRTTTSNATFALDTTQALDVDITGRFLSVGGSGSPSMTCTNLFIQVLG